MLTCFQILILVSVCLLTSDTLCELYSLSEVSLDITLDRATDPLHHPPEESLQYTLCTF